MPRIIDIPIAKLTAEAFAPFGQVLGRRNQPPHYSSPTTKTWAVKFEIDGEIELEYAHFDYKLALEFTRMERHYNVTQAFFPLGNDASATVFAPPTDPKDPKAVPKPEDMRAFYMDGAQGIMMWKGTWHTGRFPAQRSGARFTFLTDSLGLMPK